MTERQIGTIERGIILSCENDGYTISSIDRNGITTPPMLSLDKTESFSEGDKVYYFIFHDGTGRVICKL